MEQDNSLMREMLELQKQQIMELKKITGETPVYNPTIAQNYSQYAMYSDINNINSQLQSDRDKGFQIGTNIKNKINNTFDNKVNIANSLVDPMDRQRIIMDRSNRISNAAIAGVGSIAGTAGGWGINSLTGGAIGAAGVGGIGTIAGGLVGGIVGGAIIGKVADVSLTQLKQEQDINKFLFENSYRFIQRGESKNSRFGAGFSDEERYEAAKFIRNINGEKFLKDSDVQEMLQDFTSYNLLTSVKDLDSFKETTSKLIDNTKAAVITLNSTYKEITQLMADFKKIGIDAANGDFNNAISLGKVVGQYSGLDANSVIQSGLYATQQITQGTSLNSGDVYTDLLGMTNFIASYKTKIDAKSNKSFEEEQLSQYITNNGGAQVLSEKLFSQITDALAVDPTMSTLMKGALKVDSGFLTKDQDTIDRIITAFKSGDSANLNILANEARAKLDGNMELAQKTSNTVDLSNAIKGMGLENIMALLRGMGEGAKGLAGDQLGSEYYSIYSAFKNMDSGSKSLLSILTSNLDSDYMNGLKLEAVLKSNSDAAASNRSTFIKQLFSFKENLKDSLGNAINGAIPISENINRSFMEITWNGTDESKYNYLGYYDYSPSSSAKYFTDMSNSITENLAILQKSTGYDTDKTKYFTNNLVASNYSRGDRSYNYGKHSTADVYSEIAKFIGGDKSASYGDVRYKDIINDLKTDKKDLVKQIDKKYSEIKWRTEEYKNIGVYGDKAVSAVNDIITALKSDSTDHQLELAKSALETIKDIDGMEEEYEYYKNALDDRIAAQEKMKAYNDVALTFDDMRNRGIKSSSTLVRISEAFKAYEKENKVSLGSKSLYKTADKERNRRGKDNFTLEEAMQWEAEDKQLLIDKFSALSDGKINDFLESSDLANVRDLIKIAGNDGKWSTEEIGILAEKFMQAYQSSANKAIDDASNDTDISNLNDTLNKHKTAIEDTAKTLQEEIDILKSKVDDGYTYSDYAGRRR